MATVYKSWVCKMKILVLFGPDQFGGSFVIAEQIAAKLKEVGHEVLFVLKDPQMVEHYSARGYEVKVIPTMTRKIHPIDDVRTIFELNRIYIENQCCLIHSHTSKSGVYARLLKMFKPDTNVIHTVHGYYSSRNVIANYIFRSVERLLYKFSDAIIFVNTEDYNLAKKWYKHPRAKIIYNGVEVNKDKTLNDIPNTPLKIAVSARLVWEKGYRDIIELAKYLDPEKFEFHVMGEGKDGFEIKKALSGYKNVIFYGQIDYVQNILLKCHLNLLPSYREGLSLSILEAMSLGIPTLAYDIRGNRELIENGIQGTLVSPGDVDGLIQSIERYLDDVNLRKRHGLAAQDKVIKMFQIDDMLNSYLEIIHEILRLAP